MSSRSPDVIVIGAGPYGLAAAAHLREAGADTHVFGSTMSFWRQHMPKGMWLRSAWGASHISDPRSVLTLDAFERERGTRIRRPAPLTDFVAYGQWFQQRAVPEVDDRQVARVERTANGFRAIVGDESIESPRVVVAAGIRDFAARPAQFDGLPTELASHSSALLEPARWTGRRVAVVGGGQSAIESAALLHEAGAAVHLIMRTPQIHWVGRATREGLIGRLLFDRSDVGPAGISHIVARPWLMRRLPRRMQQRLTQRSLVPGGSTWLRPRIVGMPISTGREITSVERAGAGLRLRLDDGALLEFDHAVLATGYRVDVRRYAFLAPDLAAQLRLVNGHPVLDDGFQTSVDGLHILGAPAVHSFGPVVRFVSGTRFTARALARGITGARARGRNRREVASALGYASPERPAP